MNKDTRYHYDSLNRLSREDNPRYGTIVYTYDTAGNIVEKNTYSYTTAATPANLISTIGYGYDTVWTDKLTTYNGQAISYDSGTGNPISYRGSSLVWQGNQLMSYGSTQF